MEGGVSFFLGMIVLNSHNYTDWKIKMEDFLIVKDLYELIDRENIPTWVLESEWNLLNRKTVATIRQCVYVSILQHVRPSPLRSMSRSVFIAFWPILVACLCRNSVRKQVWKPNNRERNAGSMESLGLHGIHAGERERERERE